MPGGGESMPTSELDINLWVKKNKMQKLLRIRELNEWAT